MQSNPVSMHLLRLCAENTSEYTTRKTTTDETGPTDLESISVYGSNLLSLKMTVFLAQFFSPLLILRCQLDTNLFPVAAASA